MSARPDLRLTAAELIRAQDPRFLGEGQAECAQPGVNPDWFFPELARGDKVGLYIALAKATCEECPLRRACSKYAIETRQEGVWGGTTTQERANRRRVANTIGAGRFAAHI